MIEKDVRVVSRGWSGQNRIMTSLLLHQSSLPGLCPVTAAVDQLAHGGGIEERGAIFTRREVVEFILDLVGYTEDQPLHEFRLLEPSFGEGDFLLPAIDRLLSVWRAGASGAEPLETLRDCVRAVELHHATFMRTRAAVIDRLVGAGIGARVAESLADEWLHPGDFLLAPLSGAFDAVVGNPPYVRQEMIPAVLLAEYRSRYTTIYDRADLYVPFIERSLRLLRKDGKLGFICADRWMKNRYGGPLRALVAAEYHLTTYVDMTDTPAFRAEVSAYPAITVIAREKAGVTRIAHRPTIERTTLVELAAILNAEKLPKECASVRELAGVVMGAEPWILESSDQLSIIRRLERDFPTMEEVSCRIGIGVATGADRAFIGPFDALDVEADRKEPLVMTRDIRGGIVEWGGYGVVNPFTNEGSLVNLADYPRLKRYLELHREEIAGRHCAKKAPARWYRTIDRITPALTRKPKLLIPDIKSGAHIAYGAGRCPAGCVPSSRWSAAGVAGARRDQQVFAHAEVRGRRRVLRGVGDAQASHFVRGAWARAPRRGSAGCPGRAGCGPPGCGSARSCPCRCARAGRWLRPRGSAGSPRAGCGFRRSRWCRPLASRMAVMRPPGRGRRPSGRGRRPERRRCCGWIRDRRAR
ncbi:hypothetical protein CDEF62S_00174 [Castellaniella defragrans]